MVTLGVFTVSVILDFKDLDGNGKCKKVVLFKAHHTTEADARVAMEAWREKNPDRSEHYGQWDAYTTFL